jgi:hypothetical protein
MAITSLNRQPLTAQSLSERANLRRTYRKLPADRDGEVDADISYKRLPDSEGRTIKASFLDDEELTRLRTLIAAA